MKTKVLIRCGTLAPILYLATVILGGALRPGYSHVGQAISELIESGAPNKTLLDGLFFAYNLLLAGFGLGLYRAAVEPAARAGRWTGIALVATAVIGASMPLFFPMDPRGAPATFPGTMHLVMAGLSSLGSMLTILLAAKELPRYRAFSLVLLVIVFVSGGTSAYAAATASPLMGLAERVTIGSFLLWVLVLSRRVESEAVQRTYSPA